MNLKNDWKDGILIPIIIVAAGYISTMLVIWILQAIIAAYELQELLK